MQVFDNRVVDCGEHAAEFVFIFFQQRHAEALEVRAEARARHDADAFRAQEVIDKAVVQVRRLAAPFFHLLLDNRIVDFQGLVAVERAFAENDGVVERAVRRVEIQFRNVGEDFVDDGTAAANFFVECRAVFNETLVAENARNRHLRERRRADFHHLRIVDGAAECIELFVLVAVVVFRTGDVMSDLQGRRALIMGMDMENGYQKLQAKIPLKELSNYSIALSSLTGGRASFNTKFSSYELMPTDLQQQLIAENEQKDEE